MYSDIWLHLLPKGLTNNLYLPAMYMYIRITSYHQLRIKLNVDLWNLRDTTTPLFGYNAADLHSSYRSHVFNQNTNVYKHICTEHCSISGLYKHCTAVT